MSFLSHSLKPAAGRGDEPVRRRTGATGDPRLGELVRWLALAALPALISACAASGLEGPYGTGAAAVSRGQALAEQACGNCHGLGLTGASSFPGAPAFRDMRFDYNAISYERSMAQMHQGRVSMPPAEISLQQVGDIGAYVRSLKQAQQR